MGILPRYFLGLHESQKIRQREQERGPESCRRAACCRNWWEAWGTLERKNRNLSIDTELAVAGERAGAARNAAQGA